MKEMLAVALFLLLLACGSGGEDAVDSPVSRIEMIPCAVIGSGEFSGEYTFGAICDTDFLEDGSIVILDRVKCCASVFSRSGEFLYSVGCQGEGPGEFTNPDFLTPIEGGLIIFERQSAKASIFNLDGEYQGELAGCGSFQIPNYCRITGDSLLVGGITTRDETGGETGAAYTVVVCDMELKPVDSLYSHHFIMEYGDISGMLRNTSFSCSFAGDRPGNVFVAPASTEEYRILGYDMNGETILNLVLEKEMVKRSREETALEAERMNSIFRARSSETPPAHQPLEYRYMIPPNGIHTDNLGRIWVRNGLTSEHEFDVYDYHGELLFTARASGIDPSETNEVLWWSVDEHGILCFSMDPLEYSVVYFYEVPEV